MFSELASMFELPIENGGTAEKLQFIRAQGKKVASRVQKQAVRQEDGSIKYNGPVVRKNGEVFDVDCAVTGSTHGSLADPKCPLLPIFKETIFAMVEKLVGPGGKYEGYTPIFQGDNAGPHQDQVFLNGVKSHCNSKGWHWEPQAAQMPHMNVLDLSVFPCMSRRHIEKSREFGGIKVLSEDEIWDNANKVWNELPNYKIESAYIHAYRIANKVIQAKGDNSFIGSGGSIHCGVDADFEVSKEGGLNKAGGLIRKDRRRIQAPPVAQNN